MFDISCQNHPLTQVVLTGLELAYQDDAGGDQQDSADAGEADLFYRDAEQAVMIDYQCNDHLAGDYQTECHRDAETRHENHGCRYKESSENAAYPRDRRSIFGDGCATRAGRPEW